MTVRTTDLVSVSQDHMDMDLEPIAQEDLSADDYA
jgi:hypothetical protein